MNPSSYAIATVAVGCLSGPALHAEQPMRLDFSWKGLNACSGSVYSSSFELKNVPPHTQLLQFALTGEHGTEYGGSNVNYDARKAGAGHTVYFNAPCNKGTYTWTVTALADNGFRLGSAKKELFFSGQ